MEDDYLFIAVLCPFFLKTGFLSSGSTEKTAPSYLQRSYAFCMRPAESDEHLWIPILNTELRDYDWHFWALGLL